MRRASLQNIFHLSSQLGDHPDDLLEKGPAVPAVPLQLREDLSVPEEYHPAAAAGGEGVVGDHQNGGPPLPVEHLQPLQQQPGGFGVQGPGGLVGQHQGGPGDDGPGGGAALLLSAGHLIGILVQTVPDAQQLRRLLHPVPDLGGRGAEDGQGQGNVFKGGKGVQQIAVLEDEAQPLPAEAGEGPAPQAGQLLPIHLEKYLLPMYSSRNRKHP